MESFASAYAGIAGLIIFFTFFAGISLWLLRPGAKLKAEKDARIPFDED